MNVNDLYPSKYVKSDDLGNQRLTLQVGAIKLEAVEEHAPDKPVMYFNGKQKGMVLNKTNTLLCANCWGDETDGWTNQWLELFVEPKMFNGKVVNGLSVAPKLAEITPRPEATPNAEQWDTPTEAPHNGNPVDDIPF